MKKVLHFISNIFVCSVLLLTFVSCHSLSSDGRRVERMVHRQQQRAIAMAEQLRSPLEADHLDSLMIVARQYQDLIFFVYDDYGPVFWSQNLVVTNSILRIRYDEWWFGRFENTVGLGRWLRVGKYHVCTIIPLKYAFPQYYPQLPNEFIPPFKADARWLLRRQRNNEGCFSVMSADGTYLFSLVPPEMETQETIVSQGSDSFSFGSLFREKHKAPTQYQILVGVAILVCLLFVILFLIAIIRSKGLRNMKIYTKVQFMVVMIVMAVFVYVFVMSTSYVREQNIHRQQHLRQDKARFIQSALQTRYLWDQSLTDVTGSRLENDLSELSFAYETDVLVYDLNGHLVASSQPQLVEVGLISTLMAAEPYFAGPTDTVCYEQIGSLRYLTAYTTFINGAGAPLGFIAVPVYESTNEVEKEVAGYIGKLLPPYLIVLLLACLVVLIVTGQLTKSMSRVAGTMSRFELGKDNFIHYDRDDELGELIRQYNAMVRQLEQSTMQLARSERETAWRTMARQIAHEINNTLTPMKLSVQQLVRLKDTEFFDRQFDHAAKILLEQFDDLGRIATTFSDFAKMPEVRPAPTDIAEKLFSAISLMRLNEPAIPIRYVGQEQGVWAFTDEKQVGHVFTNILKNALQAMQGRPNSDIIVVLKEATTQTMRRRELPHSYNWIEISISDNGPGIPEAFRDKIFVPNFTTKSTGMGLGLAIAKNIVDGSEGFIYYDTSDKGTTFYLYFKAVIRNS